MTLLIIDGNNLAHRCRHVFSLSNRGVDVSVTYGVLHNLKSLIGKFSPQAVVFCWDGGTPEFRRQRVPEYKANRVKGEPDDYANFIRQIQELCDYALPMMGVITVQRKGVEADDLMYHMTRISNMDNIIISNDIDMMQAVNGTTQVYSPTKDRLFNEQEVLKEYGVEVGNFVHWRALQGDSSDNIPGVVGIGEKTATKLFQQYGSLSGIINAAEGCNPAGQITGKTGERIKEFGSHRITNNVYIMALYKDRLGCRKALYDTIADYQPAEHVRVKKYLLRNAFNSLLDYLPAKLSRLTAPILMPNARIPVIAKKRTSVL